MGIDLMECMRGGVTDLRLARGSPKGDAVGPDAGPHRTAVYTVLGVFHVDRYIAALMSVAKEGGRSGTEKTCVPTKFVLAQPWSVERTCREIAARRSNQDLGPIQVNRLRFPGLPDMFSVISGRHRCFVARDSGEHEITAEISSDYDCDLASFAIQGLTLKREIGGTLLPVSPRAPWKAPVVSTEAELPLDLVYILQALGIRMLASDQMPHLEAAVLRAVRGDEQ